MTAILINDKCRECSGYGAYYTEWSDVAEANSELKAIVLCYPEPPDGTVLIWCQVCQGKGINLRSSV